MLSYFRQTRPVCAALALIIWPLFSLNAAPDKRIQNYDLLIRHGEYERARACLIEFTAELPRNVEGLLRLGITESLLKNYEAAHQALDAALAVSPEDPRILHNIGLLYFREGDHVSAKQYFERTLALRPWHPETNFHLGFIYETAGEREKAMAYYIKELNENGKCAKAWQHLLMLKGDDGKGEGISWRVALICGVMAAIGMSLYLYKKRSTDKEMPCVR